MAVGFSRLAVSGYRRLKLVDVALRPFNVLIGANGIGKSSVLEVFDLLAASAEGTLEKTISGLGGLNSVLTADGRTNSVTLALDSVAGAPSYDENLVFTYNLELIQEAFGYRILREGLMIGGGNSSPFSFIEAIPGEVTIRSAESGASHDGVSQYGGHSWSETALSQVPGNALNKEIVSFRRLLANISEIHHALDVTHRAPVRLPQPLTPAQTPGADGESLLSCLYTMRETTPDRYAAVEDALRAAFPTFERLEFPPVGAGTLILGWRDRDLTRPIYANELSEGTLRFLWLATLLQSPGLPEVTLIDEPEVSLHPEMLRLLAELMREASSRTQLIVATHSDRFVRFLGTGRTGGLRPERRRRHGRAPGRRPRSVGLDGGLHPRSGVEHGRAGWPLVTVRIAIVVEGRTEAAFRGILRRFLEGSLAGKMPRIGFKPQDGRIPKGEKLQRLVTKILLPDHDAVIALTDVYTGSREFVDAGDAKAKMRAWVGTEPRFHPHAAQYDFEAWLLPYWSRIQALSGNNRRCPGSNPEEVNHDRYPAWHLSDTFMAGGKRGGYVKTRDAAAILRDQDLTVAAARCPELKAFLNTILRLSGGAEL